MTENELYHYGIKGMRWGVRRYQNADGSLTSAGKKRQAKQEKKEAKKEVKALAKSLTKSGQVGTLATMATASKFTSKDYDQLSRLMDSGRLLVNTKLKKNYAERAVDIYVGGQKTPTIRAQMKNGEQFSARFIDKADEVRYNEFADYYNNRH